MEKGDFDAVAAEKNAFILFNSGAYPGAKRKAFKKAAIKQTNDIFSAVKSQDAKALKEAYNAYLAANSITAPPVADKKSTQGFSGDFDYKVRTSAGCVILEWDCRLEREDLLTHIIKTSFLRTIYQR